MDDKVIRTLEMMNSKTDDALAKLNTLQSVLSQIASSGICVCYAMIGPEFTETLKQVVQNIKDINSMVRELSQQS